MKKMSFAFLVLFMACSFCAHASDQYRYPDQYPYQSMPDQSMPTWHPVCPDGGKLFKEDYWTNSLGGYWVDKWGFAQCNCTSYVASKLNQYLAPSEFNNSYRDVHWGDGGNWGSAAKAIGIPVDKYPLPGDAAYFTNESYGHIMWVEKVYFDDVGNAVYVDVSEYNYYEDHKYGERYKRPLSEFVGFIHILAYEEGVSSLHYMDCYEMTCPGQTQKEWGKILEMVNRYRCKSCNGPNKSVADTFYKNIGFGGYEVGPADPSQGNSPLNLGVDFDVMSLAGSELIAGQHALVKGSQIDLRAKVNADGADLSDWMVKGKDSIEVDYFAKIGGGEWMKISRQHIKAENLKKGETKTETVRFAVPDTGGQPISFQVKIDTEEEAVESNEGDNESRVETFAVKNQLDVNLIVTRAGLTNGRTYLTGGECYGVEAVTKNIGSDTPTSATRLSYQVFYDNRWNEFDSDAVDAADMVPGHEQYEKISDESCVKSTEVPGIYKFRAYADGPNSIGETNEGDNFFEFSVEVRPKPMPDLVISWAKLTNGRTSLTAGECYGMEAVGKNVGGVRSSADTRLSYQIYENGWRQIADDGVEKEIMNPNQEHWEYISNDGCVGAPNVPGWYRFRACHDAPGAIAEMNEQNNCTEFSAEVRPKPMSDLVVSAIGFKDGLVHKAKSKAHPCFWVCNVGNGPVRADFRSTYYRHGTAVDSDGTEAGLLGPGQCAYEEISGDSFQVPSNPGSYELKVILDTTASEIEGNEGNNIATVWFQVVKK